ncbi:acetyltransferase [Thiobacter aerophilum]|uniref:Acetyltransferase n=1 Tax=Thiobacter aerophilum TaxID=3121275 RepID=A0ABV0EDD9_9BURK
MTDYDVFNGDADGICALHMLRLEVPRESELVTGVKRDIGLLKRVAAGAGDRVTVLDISLDKNRAALMRMLDAGAEVTYFDHHQAGEIPRHVRLAAHIETGPEWCTSLLVDRYLSGRHRPWAVVGAFGDNLHAAARRAARDLALTEAQLDALRELGECLNYNAYGETTDDLYFHPAALYRLLHAYRDPFEFIAAERAFVILKEGCAQDLARAQAVRPVHRCAAGAIYLLPNEAWARRVSGLFGNLLARQAPQEAHAVLTCKPGGYLVSIRAPLASPSGADGLASQFATGGGRKAAAGINHLPEGELERFFAAFDAAFTAGRAA